MHTSHSKNSYVSVLFLAAIVPATVMGQVNYPKGIVMANGNPEWTKAVGSGLPAASGNNLYDWADDVIACPGPKQWGLTYDDGPSPETPKVLDALKSHDIKATFFVVGAQVQAYPDILKKAYQEGHQIALHTWSHKSLPEISLDNAIAEVVYSAMIVKDTIGVTPKFIRVPYGKINAPIRKMLHNLGLTIVAWNMDSNDWQDSTQIVSLIKERADNGDSGVVSLQHDIDAKVVAQIPKSIEVIVNGKAGYKAMPVSTCLGQEAYDEGFWTRLGAAPPSGSAASAPASAPATAPATAPVTAPATAPASAPASAPATAPASAPATAPVSASAPASGKGTKAPISTQTAGAQDKVVSASGAISQGISITAGLVAILAIFV
ncbi:chitin deacetylase [Batrachochytrium dendrobatidis]|nr:chitin deacetylase [Batrachochytrium dendrobatidis]